MRRASIRWSIIAIDCGFESSSDFSRAFKRQFGMAPKAAGPYDAGIAEKPSGVYLVMVYQSPQLTAWLREAFDNAGKKLDMGKSCLRFKSLDDVPLDVIGEVIASRSVE